MRPVFKENVGISGKRFKDTDVCEKLKNLWDTGKHKREIVRQLNISRATLDRVTKGWTRDYIEPDYKRTFDYHIAYCLLFEHGLAYKEAAQALDVKELTLRAVINRNKTKLDKSFPIWKALYTSQRVYQEDVFLQAAE